MTYFLLPSEGNLTDACVKRDEADIFLIKKVTGGTKVYLTYF